MTSHTLPPSVVSGQSNAPRTPTQFENRGYNVPGYQTGNIIGNPTERIDEIIGNKTRTPVYRFPTDLPKYHFTLVQNDWVENRQNLGTLVGGQFLNAANNLTNALTFNTVQQQLHFKELYKLPLPLGLSDEHEVKYDANFNFLGRLEALRRGASAVGSATVGLILNNIKAVTLDLPEFRTYQLAWKLSPKNFTEAQTIQKLITSLKIAMHPTPFAGKAVLAFPRIFTMYFVPNVKYLYKFKPAVISALKVDYQGGQPVPSFYKGDGGIQSESPPETVLLTLGFIELEYWLDSDFKVQRGIQDGLPTDNPFDAFNYYTYDTVAVPPGNPQP